MKMLTLSIILMTFPCLSQATGYFDRGYDDDYYFWQAVEDKQCRQSDQIDSGVESGQLTRREIKKLRREQKRVAKKIKRLRKHRHLSYNYQHELMRYLDNVSERIYNFKHNRDYNYRHHNHNPFAEDNYRRKERIYRNSVWANRDNGSAGFYFRF